MVKHENNFSYSLCRVVRYDNLRAIKALSVYAEKCIKIELKTNNERSRL